MPFGTRESAGPRGHVYSEHTLLLLVHTLHTKIAPMLVGEGTWMWMHNWSVHTHVSRAPCSVGRNQGWVRRQEAMSWWPSSPHTEVQGVQEF